jgi:integrase
MSQPEQLAPTSPQIDGADRAPRKRRRTGDDLIRCIDQWPAHPGWKRWLFRVWDKRTRNYVSEAFDDGKKAEGWAWAEHQRALLNQGKTGAGAVLFEAVGMRYVDDLRKAGRVESHVDEIERLYRAAVAAGATDMRDPEFARKVRDWLADAPCFFKPDDGRLIKLRERLAGSATRLQRAEAYAATGPKRYAAKAAKRLAQARARHARDAQLVRAEEQRVADAMRRPSPVTKNRWLVELKSIAKSARRFGVADNPLTEIKPFKADTRVKTALRLEELRAMVADARAGDGYFRQAATLVYTGMRADEAAHVRKEWIDREAGTITLRVIRDAQGRVTWAPKGNKERIVPILAELGDLVDAWLAADVAGGGSATTGWLVGDESLVRLEEKGHWKEFRAYLGRCGIDAAARDLSPHCTRHTWTALRLATGTSPNRLRRELGHAKLETTDIYAEAELLYEKAVRDWPRGEICLRRPPRAAAAPGFVLDVDQDPIAFLERFLAQGGRLEQLAAAGGVPLSVLRAWFIDGVPDVVRQYLAVVGAHAQLAAAATLMAPPALLAPATSGGAPSTRLNNSSLDVKRSR